MPALAPPAMVILADLPSGDFPFAASCASPELQGPEGRHLSSVLDEVLRHWTARSEFIVSQEENDAELSYDPVPPKKTFFVKVRYVDAGKGLPLPFDWED